MSEFKEIQYNTYLRDIKSPYIIEGLFSFLDKKQKHKFSNYEKILISYIPEKYFTIIDDSDFEKKYLIYY